MSTERIVSAQHVEDIKLFLASIDVANNTNNSKQKRETALVTSTKILKNLVSIDKYINNKEMNDILQELSKRQGHAVDLYNATKDTLEKTNNEILTALDSLSKVNTPTTSTIKVDTDCTGLDKMAKPPTSPPNDNVKVQIKSYTPVSRPVVRAKRNADGSVTMTKQVDIGKYPTRHVLMVTQGDADPKTYAIWNSMQSKYPSNNRVVYRHLNLSRKPDYNIYTGLQPYIQKYSANVYQQPQTIAGPVFYKLNMGPYGTSLEKTPNGATITTTKPTAHVPGSTTETVKRISVMRLDGVQPIDRMMQFITS